MALLIKLEDNGGLTLRSDDANAENVRVSDAFGGEPDWALDDDEDEDSIDVIPPVDYEVRKAWDEAPFNGELQVTYGPEHSKDIIEALESAGFEIPDDIYDAVFPRPGGGEKPEAS